MASVIALPPALFKNTKSEAAIITVEEKFERRLTEEISKLDKRINELGKNMSENKADIIKRMFIFWADSLVYLSPF